MAGWEFDKRQILFCYTDQAQNTETRALRLEPTGDRTKKRAHSGPNLPDTIDNS